MPVAFGFAPCDDWLMRARRIHLALWFSLLPFAFCQAAPTTAPHGYIVWASARDGVSRIYRMNADGSGIVRLVDDESDYPRWFPGGRWISYMTPDAAFIMRPDGSARTRIPINIDWPDWSPDGKGLIGLQIKDDARALIRCELHTWKVTTIADLNSFPHLKDARVAKASLSDDARWIFVMTDRFDGGYTATNGRYRPVGAWAVAALDRRNPAAIYYVGDGCQPAAFADRVYHSRGDTGAVAEMRIGDIARKSYRSVVSLDAHLASCFCPSIATDGKWLAFVGSAHRESWATGDYDVYIQSLGQPDAPRLRLAPHAANDRWPHLYIGPLQLPAASPAAPAATRPATTPAPAPPATQPARIILTAELAAISKLPSPFSIRPYRECLILAHYRVLSVIDGRFAAPDIFVVHWGMKDLKPTPESAFKPGQRVRLTCKPFSADARLSRYPLANTIPDSLDRDWWLASDWSSMSKTVNP